MPETPGFMGGFHKYPGQRQYGLEDHIFDERVRRLQQERENDARTVRALAVIFTDMAEVELHEVELTGGNGTWNEQIFRAGLREWRIGILNPHRLDGVLRVLKERFPEVEVVHTPVKLLGVTFFKDRYTLRLPL